MMWTTLLYYRFPIVQDELNIFKITHFITLRSLSLCLSLSLHVTHFYNYLLSRFFIHIFFSLIGHSLNFEFQKLKRLTIF